MVESFRKYLTKDERSAIEIQQSSFPVKIPAHYANLIEWDNPEDPLRRQVIPDLKEENVGHNESSDPLQEITYSPVPGLIHKYKGRVLWLISHTCPIHCRFCFRKCTALRYSGESFRLQLDGILNYLKGDKTIHEVIISGGDPLSIASSEYHDVVKELRQIKHIELLRIHSRYPVASPGSLKRFNIRSFPGELAIRLVIHINHPAELSDMTCEFISDCLRNSVPVLSQTVLLKNINSDFRTLYSLFFSLIKSGVQPYYLHQLDPALGTEHFRVSEKTGKALIKKLSSCLPGYAIPDYVCDIPGRDSKTKI